ncbi:MAG: TonB-dependent receptor [Bacteroidota bacterium]
MHARFLSLLLTVCLTGSVFGQQTGTIQGTVSAADTQERLIGVNVTLAGTTQGASTNAKGGFTLNGLAPGTYQLEFRYLGFQPYVQTDIVVRPGRVTTVRAALNELILETDGVTVTAGYYQRSATELTSVASFSAEEIRRAPGAAQEITRVLNALPGVTSRGETSQDLFVRGGSPAENGFYIDQIFVPNTQHFSTGDGSSFGPTGLINTEFVEDIDFYTGGFSAAYGDRMSSISTIRYREGNASGFTGEVGLNFSGGTGLVEGPLPAGRGTFFVSGRRSYLDLVADAINAGGAPTFGDMQGKVSLQLAPRHTLSLLNLYGQSRFQQTAQDARDDGTRDFIDSRNNQNTTGLNWRALWQAGGYSSTSLSYSFRRSELDSRLAETNQVNLTDELVDRYLHLRSVHFYERTPRAKTEFGAEMLWERGRYTRAQPAFVSRTGVAQPGYDQDLTLDNLKAATFASAIVRPVARLQVTAGARLDYASLNNDFYVSPRLALAYQLTNRLTLTASAGRFLQAVPLFITSQNPANEDLRHMEARHYIAGFDYLLTPSTKLTVEAYRKDYTHIPELADTNPLGDPTYVLDNRGDFSGELASTGTGYAQGLDVMVQKKMAKNLYGLASASLLRSRYTDFQGIERDRAFDTRLLFNVVGGYKPSDRWEMSVRWSYNGGRPFTPIDVEQTRARGEEVLDLTQFHDDRLPAYHSLFLRVDRRFFFQSSNLVAFLSLWNAYNRSNVEEVYWNVNDLAVDEQTQFSTLPIVGVEFEF